MRNWRIFFLVSILSMSLASGACIAADSPQFVILCNLQPGSSFQQGCIPPCMCPVMMSDTVRGTFELSPGPGPGPRPMDSTGFTTYSLTGISWKVYNSAGKPVHTITGNGTYRFETVGNGAVRHQLTLEVSIDNQASVTLDSGLILGCAQFPEIAISVRRGSTCLETSMDIIAR